MSRDSKLSMTSSTLHTEEAEPDQSWNTVVCILATPLVLLLLVSHLQQLQLEPGETKHSTVNFSLMGSLFAVSAVTHIAAEVSCRMMQHLEPLDASRRVAL